MAQPNSQKPLKFVTSVPAVVIDGHGVGVDPSSGAAAVTFFQLVSNQDVENADFLEANLVANVRLTHEQLKGLYESLGEAIEDFNKNKAEQSPTSKTTETKE